MSLHCIYCGDGLTLIGDPCGHPSALAFLERHESCGSKAVGGIMTIDTHVGKVTIIGGPES